MRVNIHDLFTSSKPGWVRLTPGSGPSRTDSAISLRVSVRLVGLWERVRVCGRGMECAMYDINVTCACVVADVATVVAPWLILRSRSMTDPRVITPEDSERVRMTGGTC